MDNTGISNVKRGVSIAADNASVVINSSEIVARYYGVTVGASGVELSVNGGTVQGWAAIMFTANGWTVDRIKSNKGAVVNAQDAKLVGRSISDEGYGIVVVQQDYNGAELTFSDCTMLTTVEDGKTGAWQGGIVVRSYGNKISVSGGYIESSNITERNLMGMALVSLYNTYFAQTEADPQDKANEFSISNWEIDESFETPFVLRDGIDTLTVDFGEPLEGTYAVQDERWYDINSTTENYSVESDLTAIVDQGFYVKNQGTLTIKAGATLTVESDVAFWLNDGNTLVIEAGATLVVKGAVVEGKIVNNGRVEVYGKLAEKTSIEGNGEWVYGNVTEAEQLKALFANEALTNLTIVLGADFGTEEARSSIKFVLSRNANITLDMNRHSIYSNTNAAFILLDGSLTVDNGLVNVDKSEKQGFAFQVAPSSEDKVATLKLGSKLTAVSNCYAAVAMMPQNKTNYDVLNAVLVTEATITSNCTFAALCGQGTMHGTSITINGGKISGKLTAIYHPQYGEMTVNGGEIEGATAIEMRAGKLVVNSGTMIGNGDPFESDPNGNGATTLGAAVAAVQHTTKLDLSVEINGGTLQGARAFYQANLQNNGKEALEKISITLGKSAFYDGKIIVDSAEATIEDDQSTRYYMTLQQAVYAAKDGKTVVLLKDVEVGEAGNAATGLVVSGTVTVDFNGFTVSNVGTGYAVVVSGSDAKVTLIDSSKEQTGGIHGGSGGNNQALRVQDGAKVEIYGGNYNVGVDAEGFGNSTVAISTDSVVYIYGGRFASEGEYEGKYFVLNVQQTTGAKGEFQVFGGTFVGQNPADGDDALGGSFVAEGYEAFVSKEATDDSLAEYTVGKVYEAGSEEALREAIEAAQGFSVVRLTADVDLKEELYINGVDLMLDLNGFTLSLHYGEGVKRKNCSTLYVANATLIINDSSEDKSGRVENTDTTGGTNLSSKDNNYAVRVGREANLIINGGTFYTSADSAGNGNSVILIYSTSSNESTVTINGGVFETEAAYNGTYFVLNVQDGFKGGYVVCGGTFKGYKPGTTNTGELATVPEGYEIAEQEIENGVVWYTVQKAQ